METLSGGNISNVFSDGKCVYREMKRESETIHRLLSHLKEKNINFTPKFLGVDNERNLEILSFVKGETLGDYPSFDDLDLKSKMVKKAGEMLREYHDATADFKHRVCDKWFLSYEGKLEKEVICHNDFAPYNVTFINQIPVGLIDFDTACPAPRVWDIAYGVYRFIPLTRTIYDVKNNCYREYEKELDLRERKILLSEFLKGYGFEDRELVLDNVILRLKALVKLFEEECNDGNASFIKMRNEGHEEFYINEIRFLEKHIEDLK
ncbi:MAG: phosphotransferase enzyme family protein [Clostridium sp.]